MIFQKTSIVWVKHMLFIPIKKLFLKIDFRENLHGDFREKTHPIHTNLDVFMIKSFFLKSACSMGKT